jgi:Zn-dependent membrane protease YugP
VSREDETPAERHVRLGWRWAASLGIASAVLFIAGIVLESGKAAGVGGVLLGAAIVVASFTAIYMDEHNL